MITRCIRYLVIFQIWTARRQLKNAFPPSHFPLQKRIPPVPVAWCAPPCLQTAWHAWYMGASTRGAKTSKDKQSRPHASIQPFNLSHNHAHRETVRSPTAFTHFPTCILALCDIPPRALCDIPPHAFLRYTCRLCEGLGATRRAAPYTLHTHYIIFADLRRTRRDTCAAHLQTCEGTWCNWLGVISVTLCISTLRSLGKAYWRHTGHWFIDLPCHCTHVRWQLNPAGDTWSTHAHTPRR